MKILCLLFVFVFSPTILILFTSKNFIADYIYNATDNVQYKTFCTKEGGPTPLPGVSVRVERHRVDPDANWFYRQIDVLIRPSSKYDIPAVTDEKGEVALKKLSDKDRFYFEKKDYQQLEINEDEKKVYFEATPQKIIIQGPPRYIKSGSNILYKFILYDSNDEVIEKTRSGSFTFSDTISGERKLNANDIKSGIKSSTDGFWGNAFADAQLESSKFCTIKAKQHKFSVYNYFPNKNTKKTPQGILLTNENLIISGGKNIEIASTVDLTKEHYLSLEFEKQSNDSSLVIQFCGVEFLIGGAENDRITTRKFHLGGKRNQGRILSNENMLEAPLPQRTPIILKIKSVEQAEYSNVVNFDFDFYYKYEGRPKRILRTMRLPITDGNFFDSSRFVYPLIVGSSVEKMSENSKIIVRKVMYY